MTQPVIVSKRCGNCGELYEGEERFEGPAQCLRCASRGVAPIRKSELSGPKAQPSRTSRKRTPVKNPSRRRRGRKPVDPFETPEERFKRISKYRLAKALDSMRLLGNLSRPSQYSFTKQQVEKLLSSLDDGVARVRIAFSAGERQRRMREAKSARRASRGPKDTGRFRDTRTARERFLDRHKEGRRFAQRRLGPGPR